MAVSQNGTGALAPIQGGPPPAASASMAPPAASAAAPPPPPAAAAPPAAVAPPAAGSMAGGTGNVQGGSCSCACLCGVSSFPTAAQGINNFGGMTGKLSSPLNPTRI
jgi:hypothetical protein